jgi:hypothetical protein
VALLLLGVLRHYGWAYTPDGTERFWWNIGGSVVILFLAWSAFPAARLVVLWLTFEELQVIACSLIRILRPQPIGAGQSQCSALLGFDLGTVGLMLVGMILAYPVISASYQKTRKKP